MQKSKAKLSLAVTLCTLAACQPAAVSSQDTCGKPPVNWIDQAESLSYHSQMVINFKLMPVESTATQELHFDNGPISIGDFKSQLQKIETLVPQPILALEYTDAIDCSTLQKVRELMNQTKLCQNSGWCSENVDWGAQG